MEDTTIRSIEIATMRLPMRAAVPGSTDAAAGIREMVAVRVLSRHGHDGHAYAYTRGLPLAAMIRDVARQLVGQPVPEVRQGLGAAFQRKNTSVWPALARAVGVIDVAIADLRCQERGTPLHRMLTNSTAPEVNAIPVVGYGTEGDGPDALVEEVSTWLAKGHRHVKVHLLGDDLASELARAGAILETCGPDRVGFDFYYRFQHAEDAVQACRQLHESGAAFIEDPLPYWDQSGLMTISQESSARLAIGEDVTAAQSWEVLSAAVQFLRVDATVCGGIAPALVSSQVASKHDLMVFPHVFAGLHARIFANDERLLGVEFIPRSQGVEPINEFTTNDDKIRDGRLCVSEEATAGMRLDWQRVSGLDATDLVTVEEDARA